MNKTSSLKIAISVIIFGVAILIGFLLGQKFTPATQVSTNNSPEINSEPLPTSLEYKNNDYGFSVTLPLSWQGYTVSIDKWTGNTMADELGEKPFTDGPVISVHSPKWTGPNTYQDIPLMVFTLEQWGDLQAEKFHIGAAPIGPSELGRNSKYVFALPARYNFAYPPGTEEVQAIIDSKPLKTF